jgi:hypothetical protein
MMGGSAKVSQAGDAALRAVTKYRAMRVWSLSLRFLGRFPLKQ